MNGPLDVLMHRQPITAATRVWTTTEGAVYSEVVVVCNDGAAFALEDDGYKWRPLPAVPGSQQDVVNRRAAREALGADVHTD